MRKILLLISLLFIAGEMYAQSFPEIPLMRKIFHENIDNSQKSIEKLDGKEDKRFAPVVSDEINRQITYALFQKVDNIQVEIELDARLNANDKIKYLRGINEALSLYESGFINKSLTAAHLSDLINAFEESMELEKNNQSIYKVINENDLEVGEILVRCFPFQQNAGIKDSKDILVLKLCQKYPDRILPILKNKADYWFADSLIKIVSRTNQEDLYNYAQSFSQLARKIHDHSDPLVSLIAQLSKMKTGRLFFPFLDIINSGKSSIAEIEKTFDNEYQYYGILVKTQIEYAGRVRTGDTPMGMQALTGMLRKKAIEYFISEINELHDSPDPVRMKKVEPLNPQELYYLCVLGETEIYTSSYLKVYDRIFQRMKNPSGDTLLMSVNFDFFKKFIKMAAGYNKLDDFLKRMPLANSEILMRAFANGLDKNRSLEDAVDVADSYASISDTVLRKLILDEIQQNLARSKRENNKRGMIIYDLLTTLFYSMDSSKNINLEEKFGIPSVQAVSNASLKNDKDKRIIIQQFFYGDKDGMQVFNYFKAAYSNANWRIVNKPDWIEVSSTNGTPVTIYANKPFDETQGLDAKAQKALGEYLHDNGLDPSVVIHRGHSYFVSSTLSQLEPSAKVVLLGSCGGFHNINKVLKISPYAHIIASKQVGSGTINQPMIINITDLLRQGKDLNWPAMWKEFEKRFKGNEMFDDYIPPFKNLGAIFIMTFNRVMQSEG